MSCEALGAVLFTETHAAGAAPDAATGPSPTASRPSVVPSPSFLQTSIDRCPRHEGFNPVRSERRDNADPPCSRKATQGLLKLFAAMDQDCASRDPDASIVRHKTAVCCQKLAETARAAGTTLNIDRRPTGSAWRTWSYLVCRRRWSADPSWAFVEGSIGTRSRSAVHASMHEDVFTSTFRARLPRR